MTFIDTLDQTKVDDILAKFGDRLHAMHHVDDLRFALWLDMVDRTMVRRIGVGYRDIEDWGWRDAYDADQTPQAAVEDCLTSSPWAALEDWS